MYSLSRMCGRERDSESAVSNHVGCAVLAAGCYTTERREYGLKMDEEQNEYGIAGWPAVLYVLSNKCEKQASAISI
jgi:hypothetical protein